MSLASAPRVLIRADAGPRIGSGHVMRCLSLADELARRGAHVSFATHAPAGLLERISSSGHLVVDLGTLSRQHHEHPSTIWSPNAQLNDWERVSESWSVAPDIVVLDHYGLDVRWASHLPADTRVVVLDDLANRSHRADVIIDHNWYGAGTAHRYDSLVDPSAVHLLGPRYAVLQSQYRGLQRTSPVNHPPRNVVVSFGGTDPGRETLKVLEALTADAPHVEVDVVVGSVAAVDDDLGHLLDEHPTARLHVAVDSLAPLLARADLAIGASGAATWERLAAGVPSMVATVAPHQSGVTSALAAAGATTWLGLVADTTVDTYRRALENFVSAPPAGVTPVVDGFGAARIAEAVIPSTADQLEFVPLHEHHGGAIMGIEAESQGRDDDADGLLAGPQAWVAEFDRFSARLQQSSDRVVEALGVPVALIGPDAELSAQRCVSAATAKAIAQAAELGTGDASHP